MAEFSNFMLKAYVLLATPNHEGLAAVVDQLFMRRETNEYKSAKTLYDFFVNKFANLLTLKLLKVYRCSSSDGAVRFRSIYLLSETLTALRNRNVKLSLVSLHEIKPLLISCLTMQETRECDIKILRRILSFVAYDVVMLDNNGWDELSDCIVSLAVSEPRKAFHVFVDLPPVYGKFIYKFMQIILEKAEKVLLNPEKDRVGDWSLALETVVKMGIQLLDSEMRFDLIKDLLDVLVKSASELVEKGMEQFLLRGLKDLERFLARDKNLYNYSTVRCDFVSGFMFKIRDLGTHTKEATKKIHRLVKSSHNLSPTQPHEKLDHGARSERNWFDHLINLSPIEILRIFASTDLEERYRDMAIIQLNLLLSDHTSRKVVIDVSVMRELQPLIISCLSKEGISESTFKVLGEVVYHVAHEMMYIQDETWYGLRDYIISKSKTNYHRAVYIFQCLTMWLEYVEFVIPVMKSLLQEIRKRLNPTRELLVDNSCCWVLTFVGAFCAIIHLADSLYYAETVREIANEMIYSVSKLVEIKMEVELVRRAFRDVESIVKKQREWFGKREYKLFKSLLRRLYEIEDMKIESKIVLWRINVFVERGMTELAKNLTESEVDWMYTPAA